MRLLIFFIILLFYNSFAFAQQVCTEREVKTEIIIHANSDSIWKVLINTKNYPNWNPYIYAVAGIVKKGKMVSFRMKGNKKDRVFSAKILELDSGKRFAWGGGLLFFLKAKHYFVLVPVDESTTKLIQGEYWKGLFGKALGKNVYKDACENFVIMNTKLKQLVEKNVD
jgi:hypothetical protein